MAKLELLKDETILAEFRAHWSRLLREILIAVGAVVVAILLTIWFDGDWRWWVIGLMAVVVLFVTIPNVVRWFTGRYILTTKRTIHRTGVFASKSAALNLEVVNNVSYSAKWWEQIVHSGDVMIETAGEHGQNHWSNVPKPEKVQAQIQEARENRLAELRGGGVPAQQIINPGQTSAQQIDMLANMLDEGKLTQAEFDAEKARILGGGRAAAPSATPEPPPQ
jgi:uncharacterized membrane protein YdbT with pleckstrin-like domain